MRTRIVLTVALATVAAIAMLALGAGAQQLDPEGPDATDTVVLDGADRYETAALIARGTGNPNSTQALYIANGQTLVDALAIGVSAAEDAKLLLVTRDTVPDATAEALAQISHAKLVFLGGDAAISPAVRDQVAALTCNYARGEC